jgi:hypothetical protein
MLGLKKNERHHHDSDGTFAVLRLWRAHNTRFVHDPCDFAVGCHYKCGLRLRRFFPIKFDRGPHLPAKSGSDLVIEYFGSPLRVIWPLGLTNNLSHQSLSNQLTAVCAALRPGQVQVNLPGCVTFEFKIGNAVVSQIELESYMKTNGFFGTAFQTNTIHFTPEAQSFLDRHGYQGMVDWYDCAVEIETILKAQGVGKIIWVIRVTESWTNGIPDDLRKSYALRMRNWEATQPAAGDYRLEDKAKSQR